MSRQNIYRTMALCRKSPYDSQPHPNRPDVVCSTWCPAHAIPVLFGQQCEFCQRGIPAYELGPAFARRLAQDNEWRIEQYFGKALFIEQKAQDLVVDRYSAEQALLERTFGGVSLY